MSIYKQIARLKASVFERVILEIRDLIEPL